MNRKNCRGIVFSLPLLAFAVVSFSDTARAQSVTASPSVLNFTVGPNVQSSACNGNSTCTVHVTGNGVGTIQAQVDNNSTRWLTVRPIAANLPTDLTVTVDTSTLPSGNSTGTFLIFSSAARSIQTTVTVNVTVTGTSQLSATPNAVTFQAQQGATSGTPQSGTCPHQNTTSTCQITAVSADGAIHYNISTSTADGAPWLLVDATSGDTSLQPFNVGVNPSAVSAAGTYTGSILLQSTTSSSDQVTVNITMVVSAPPSLLATPAQLSYFYTLGSPLPPAQTVTVSASSGSVPFSVTVSTGATWVVVSQISGVASATSSVPISVSVSPNSPTQLGVGPHSATITINPTGGGAGQTVNVSLYVSVNQFLTIPTTQLSFNAPFGGSAPPAQTVIIGTTAGQLNYTASASSDQNWLSVTPNAGVTGTASGTISASVNQGVLASLGVGTYNGSIVISPTNGDTYSLQITATLTVGSASQITAAPQALYFSFQTGLAQTAPAAQTITLTTSGPPVSFAVSTSLSGSNPSSCGTGSWLAATAQTVPLTTPNVITVTVNPAGMTTGICTGNVQISYGSNTVLQVPVTLFVASTPLLNISLPPAFGFDTTTLAGPNLSHQLSVTSTDGTTAINYQVAFTSAPCAWLFAAPSTGGSAGTTPGTIQVNILPSCLAVAQSYQGSITITSPNLPQAVTFPITLQVTSLVQVAVTPQSLTFQQAQNGPLPPAQTLSFTVSGGNANFQATASTDFGNWLQVTPSSGNTNINSVSVSIVANSLPPSTTPYNGQITFNFVNAATPSQVVKVRYTVTPPQTLTVSPNTALTFSYQLNGSAPPAQPLNLSSTGGAVNFTASASSTGGWLGVDTPSGTTPANGSAKVVNVTVDPTKIPSGTLAGAALQGAVTINAAGVLANPIILNVTLNITAAPIPQPVQILNSASNSAAAVAPGELITIKGNGLGPASPATGTSFSINSRGTVDPILAGVEVTFNGTPGIPTFVSATQINVIVPWEAASFSSVSMVILFNGGQSAPLNLNVVPVSPAIYTQNAQGTGQAAAVNLSPTAASPYNGPSGSTYPGTSLPLAPAPQGSYVAFFLAGCGQTNPPSVTGAINSSTTLAPLQNWVHGSAAVKATIGGVPSPDVQFAGAAPTLISGVCQVNLQVPTVGGISGTNVAVKITINGVDTLGAATISVQ